MNWLVCDNYAEEIVSAMSAYAANAQAAAAVSQEPQASSRGYELTVVNGVAQIEVKGLLVKDKAWWMNYLPFKVTGYGEILRDLGMAESNLTVKEILLSVDSGGGQVNGVFNVVAALQAAKKPIKAVVDGVSASAAYLIASQAESITCVGPACMIGSIGVVTSVSSSKNEITSTKAPFKRPNPATEEGRAAIRSELDELHELFTDAVSQGRNVSKEKIDADFGRGGILLSDKAKSVGMVDAVQKFVKKKVKKSTGAQAMNYEELKAQHPELFAQAKAEGAKEAMVNVKNHLLMATTIDAVAEGSALSVATEAIKAGKSYDECRVEYDVIGMKKKMSGDRQEETPHVDADANNGEEGMDFQDLVAQKVLGDL